VLAVDLVVVLAVVLVAEPAVGWVAGSAVVLAVDWVADWAVVLVADSDCTFHHRSMVLMLAVVLAR